MLQTVARRPRPIAYFFITIMYLQLLVPVRGVYAESRTFFYHSPILWQSKNGPAPVPGNIALQQQASVRNRSNAFSVSIENDGDHEAPKKEDSVTTGGPSQPEMSSFQSVNANNMVDLFSGDFQYNIPLMDVGGYPINLSYRGGISMDQEASWVGLGWSVNPGTITRNMRGLPDDFNGRYDSVKKINSIRENKTIGVTVGADVEIAGFPKGAPKTESNAIYSGIGLGGSLGVFLNNYKGWGIEHALNVSINSGQGAKGPLSGGLSITNNSQDGLTVAPSFSVRAKMYEEEDKSASGSSSFSISLPYNSRSGMKGLQFSSGVRQYTIDTKNQASNGGSNGGSWSSTISFVSPSYTPTISIPYTCRQFSFTAKVGTEVKVFHPSLSISGYVSKQGIDKADTLLTLPSYGYLNFYEGSLNSSSLLDFNREKEIPYREKPAVQHIAVPGYTYDAFSITGEGTGGMFRAYRGDIGFVFDHFMRTKDMSDRLSVDVGVTDLVHAGVDLNINRAYSQSSAWTNMNMVKDAIRFRNNAGTYEAVYFRNPSEKAINSKKFYDAIGGDDVVAVNLAQPGGDNTSQIYATNYLTRYRNKRVVGQVLLNAQNAYKDKRDKRTQVISYLTAREANIAGLSKYIENYTVNQFNLANCSVNDPDYIEGNGTGLTGEYYPKINLTGTPQIRPDPNISFDWGKGTAPIGGIGTNGYSIRWSGRIKAPVTGTYTFTSITDDGFRLWINDMLVINDWKEHGTNNNGNASGTVNLVAGEMYNIKAEYFENKGYSIVKLLWAYPGQSSVIIPQTALYGKPADFFTVGANLVKEKRVNRFRKENHISQISVLNTDGRRYVYGIPVYNLKQRDVTFSVNKDAGNRFTGLVKYNHGVDNTANNTNGKDWYFNSEEVPAYAHSFLLTGILSPDYMDLTGNGITDDDPGDAVKLNYSKVCGISNPYRWRMPYVKDSVTYNEGLRSYSRDDKGSYVYGEKELWFLHSIESKTMVAAFTVENRLDLMAIDEAGNKYNDGTAKRLKQINLYSKADFIKNPATAVPVKTVHFEYGYELCKGVNKPVTDSGKLTLKKVWFTYNGNNKGKQNPYVFHYSNTNPGYNIKAYDRWGNYKDAIQNPGSTNSNLISNDECPYALQDSAKAAVNATAWTLDSIYLPSGGSLKVDLESDEYAYVQNRRAMQLFKILGMGPNPNMPGPYFNSLYNSSYENLYIYVTVPDAVATKQDVYRKYLEGITKLYFRLNVRMPDDKYGSGYEYVTGYADIEDGGYGRVNNNTIWIKVGGVSLSGNGGGSYSPLAKAAIQYLRLNLPGKAYPGSEVGEDLDLAGAVKILASMASNIVNAFSSFDRIARIPGWASLLDLNRSYVRLRDPDCRKLGGGHRVKRITIYDNWDKMASQRPAIYGQEYTYTTTKEVNGVQTTISSGVAQYEPGIGADENPFHQPIEYTEKTGILGPVTMGYTEEPLGESFFPSASVGYSKVRVRTINYKEKKSANGYAETQFYTAYDFPVYTDRSMLDGDTKKRYKPSLANFLRINAKHHLVMSQGFKIELNDMHGKLRSEATYSETNPKDYVTYTEHIYRVEDVSAESKRLSNMVPVMNPDGTIDTAGIIGKDVELMTDMREQLSVTNGYNVNLNSELFSIPFPTPPFFLLPTFLNLAQREENLFRSVATLKVIQRYGIVDSVISIDKGSRVTAHNIMYDSETGDVVLTRTQNEFNDPLYQFNYPSHWAYDGMGLAYKNIDAQFEHVTVTNGRITGGIPNVNDVFSSGDEILVGGKVQTGTGTGCTVPFSTFSTYTKIWAIDTSVIRSGTKTIYFIDKDGKAYNGYDVTLKITRSGRRNQLGSVGSVNTLVNPIIKNVSTGNYQLVLNTASKVISTGVNEFRQYWKVAEYKKQKGVPACLSNENNCKCLRLFFEYLFRNSPGSLYLKPADGVLVRNLVWAADSYYRSAYPFDNIDLCECSILNDNLMGLFYSYGNDSYNAIMNVQIPYLRVRIGRCIVRITFNFSNNNIWSLNAKSCGNGVINYSRTNPACRTWFANYRGTGAQLNYTDCSGQAVTVNLPAGDSVYRYCAPNLGTFTNCSNCWTNWSTDQSCNPNDTRTTDATVHVESCEAGSDCDSANSVICYNPLTDSTVNPYLYGLLGNWRSNRNYVYYGSRAEEDPATATNIRTNGTFADFVPFWQFTSGKLQPNYDTTRWVWNSELTLFNSKGLEVENKDPLGRYNSGLYGYSNSLPTAVAQNARYREVAFEGFEDYGYNTQACDNNCPAQRHVDFSAYAAQFDTVNRHSGKRSLRLLSQQSAGITVNLATAATDTSYVPLIFTTEANSCSSGGNVLTSIQTTTAMVLPTFAPSVGQRMVVSAWVKEDQDCKCTSYTNNKISVIFNGSGAQSISFTPAGGIIEGWQRYEGVFDIPANTVSLTVSMQSIGSPTVYFDDLRLHPFNGNMKSFVFHPVNLRLMAEMDENNYATFYEYDDDGTLIRVKKETQRGIKTIQETRSALIKE